MEMFNSGNELKALCKIAKKYKMACPITDKLMVTPDHVQYIINPRRSDNKNIAVDSKQLASIVKVGKTDYTVKVDNVSIEINGITIPTIPVQDEINQSAWVNYERVTTFLEYDANGIRTDNEIMIPVEQLQAFCGTLDNAEGIKIHLSGQTAIFTGTWHKTSSLKVDIPYRSEDANDITVHLGNEYVKRWLSLASASSSVQMRIESDYPTLMTIKINGCWFDTIIAPRIENE